MNYKIIADEKKLKEFINWLPDLKDNETYYLSLFARKKYCPDLIKSNDKTQLKRFTSSKERLFQKIRQLELPKGYWTLKDQIAPQESLVLYIMVNPRCMKKATHMMGKKCWDLVGNTNYNLIAEAQSCIQQSKSRTTYVHFDIDTKDVDVIEVMDDICGDTDASQYYRVVETRGGFHLLIDPVGISSCSIYINWHGEIRNQIPEIDQVGDMMLPIPGTFQGGFIPKFI